MHGFRTLLDELATVARHTVHVPALPKEEPFEKVTAPKPFQREVFARVGLHALAEPCRQKAPA
ncbi:MAG: hypothetical protein AB1609_17350 [Bacillota bacterium]